MGGGGEGGEDSDNVAAGGEDADGVFAAADGDFLDAVFVDCGVDFYGRAFGHGGARGGEFGEYDGEYFGLCDLSGSGDVFGYAVCAGVWEWEEEAGGVADAEDDLFFVEYYGKFLLLLFNR